MVVDDAIVVGVLDDEEELEEGVHWIHCGFWLMVLDIIDVCTPIVVVCD